MQSTERKRMTAEERELFAALFALDNILDKFAGFKYVKTPPKRRC